MNINLNNDVLYYFAMANPSEWPKLMLINSQMQSFALECFRTANLRIFKAFPLLNVEITGTENSLENAQKIFMKINSHLQTEALRLNCMPEFNSSLNTLDNNCANYECLVENIIHSTNVYKKEALNILTLEIARQLKLSIPDEVNVETLWNKHLKNHEDLKKITELQLSRKGLKFLPPEIGRLTNLKILDLSINNLKSFPEELSHLSNLIDLNLNNNKFDEIPSLLGNLSNLRHLRMRANSLKTISFNFKLLSLLELLDLSENKLLNFPHQITDLEHLTKLSIDSADLENLPSQLELKALTSLSLGNNQLKEINPNLFTFMPKLRNLFLKSNPLNSSTLLMLETEMQKSYILEIELDGN